MSHRTGDRGQAEFEDSGTYRSKCRTFVEPSLFDTYTMALPPF